MAVTVGEFWSLGGGADEDAVEKLGKPENEELLVVVVELVVPNNGVVVEENAEAPDPSPVVVPKPEKGEEVAGLAPNFDVDDVAVAPNPENPPNPVKTGFAGFVWGRGNTIHMSQNDHRVELLCYLGCSVCLRRGYRRYRRAAESFREASHSIF